MASPKSLLALTVAVAAFAAMVACNIEVKGATGKSCLLASDCPEPLVCVQARSGGQRTCEALALPEEVAVETDAGVAYYCDEVRLILDNACASCHNEPPSEGAPPKLDLDTYETVGDVRGARESAERIYIRAVVDDTMPPGNPLPRDQQQTLEAWFKSGAPLCPDGGT